MTRCLWFILLLAFIKTTYADINETSSYENCLSEPQKSLSNCKPCETRKDCGNGYQCTSNIAKNGTSKGCMCYDFFGYHGLESNCMEDTDWAASRQIAIIAIFIIPSLWALRNFVLFSYITFILVQKDVFKIKKPNCQTLILIGLSNASLFLWSIFYVLIAARVGTTLELFEDSLKPPILGIMFVSGSLSVLNVSVVWLEIAQRSKTLAKSSKGILAHGKTIVRTTSLVFALLATAALALGMPTTASLLSLFIIFISAVSYGVGGSRLAKIINASSKSKPGAKNGRKRARTGDKVRQVSIHLSIMLAMYIMSAMLYNLMGGSSSIFVPIGVGGMQLSMALVSHILMAYIKYGSRRHFRKRRIGSSTQQSFASSTGSDGD